MGEPGIQPVLVFRIQHLSGELRHIRHLLDSQSRIPGKMAQLINLLFSPLFRVMQLNSVWHQFQARIGDFPIFVQIVVENAYEPT